MSARMSVARGFAAAREKLGWTHYRLAKESGLPWRTVVRLEQEGTNPTLSTVNAAATALGYRVRMDLISKQRHPWNDDDDDDSVEYMAIPFAMELD